MRASTSLILVLAIGILCIPAGAQCNPALGLVTTGSAVGQAGVMFDLEPTGGVPLRIESFDIYVTGTNITYEVWVRSPLESYVGFNTTNVGWTMIGLATGVNGSGTTAPVPLNLCMAYTLQPGGKTGFYVTTSGGGTHWYNSGNSLGAVWGSDSYLTVYQGVGGTYFSPTISPRCFYGTIRYDLGENILEISQSGPGVGDLSIGLTSISPTAASGWMLVTADTSHPAGTGPFLGIYPDAGTWLLLTTTPQGVGNPFHFPTVAPAGLFPSSPFVLGPGSTTALTGMTLDAVILLVTPGPFYDSKSNVVRITMQ